MSSCIGKLKIDPSIMNASGIYSFPPVLKTLQGYGAYVTKSVSWEERSGNETPIYTQFSEETSLNAVGLSNPGMHEVLKELKDVYPLDKPIFVSIFGETIDDFVGIAEGLEDVCDGFELNFSCPNLIQGEKAGMIIGRDPALVEQYTKAVRDATQKLIIVKLSPGPYVDDDSNHKRIKDIAKAALDNGADALSAINTVPGGMDINIYAKRPILSARYGGVSGHAIMPIGLGCIYTLYESFPEISIIGIGGIRADKPENGAEDVIKYIEAGASAVALGTHAEMDISKLNHCIEFLIEDLGYDNLQELRGIAHG